MTRLRTRRPAWFFGSAVVLLVVALGVVACAQPAAPTPEATSAPAPTATTAAAAPTPVPPATSAASPAPKLNLPAGVDAEGDFYRGDPKAPVKLVEFSDFQ
jgi:protein-disulfide isomerase